MELIGIFFIACGLLVLAGVAKAVRPDDTARALVLLVPGRTPLPPSFRLTRLAVRMGAIVEAVLGACALFFPRTMTAAFVAVSYMAFLAITVYAKRRGGALSTCGCFGRPDTPSTGLHVVLNLVFMLAAVAVAVAPPHSNALVTVLNAQPWNGVPLLLASGIGVWLAYLALSHLAALEAARRLDGHTNGEQALSL
jgi:hypothetical protein